MIIYFIQLLTILLPLAFGVGVCARGLRGASRVFVAAGVGFLFAYFAFFIAARYLRTEELGFYTAGGWVAVLAALWAAACAGGERFAAGRLALAAAAAFCSGVGYFVATQDFPVFTSSLLDTEAIFSVGFLLLAVAVAVFLFFFARAVGRLRPRLALAALLVVVALEANKAIAAITLTAMRNRVIEMTEGLLSYAAKSAYYSQMSIYAYFALFVALALALVALRERRTKKSALFDTAARKNRAFNAALYAYAGGAAACAVVAVSLALYFNLVASKPLAIDEPTRVRPDERGEFVFDVAMLRDNKLHRYAYVSDEGRVIRFWLINKREDRDSPVAVFDACMICGDMGYVKRGSEIICIACNVRIFPLSVGKEGGCNPIPLPHTVADGRVKIALKDVLMGVNYFTQIEDVEVTDPVSGAKFMNSAAEFRDSYGGFTYYFENEENYEKFRAAPQNFVDENHRAKWRTQGY